MNDEKKVSDLLKGARALIAKKRNWCQKADKKESWFGRTSYCMMGAIIQAARSDIELLAPNHKPAIRYLNVALGNPNGYIGSIVNFNDSHKHKEVIEVMDFAIQLAEADEWEAKRKKVHDEYFAKFLKTTTRSKEHENV